MGLFEMLKVVWKAFWCRHEWIKEDMPDNPDWPGYWPSIRSRCPKCGSEYIVYSGMPTTWSVGEHRWQVPPHVARRRE